MTDETIEKLRQEVSIRITKLKEEGEQLEGWLYLVHHVHVNEDTGEETIHHCPLVDHLGNKYTIDHITDKDGGITHALIDLMPDQVVYWSNEEAEADGQTVPCANRQLEG